MQFHPLAELFPQLDPSSLTELADSILADGQREPIVVYEGKILDGRSRFHACELIGVKPRTRLFNGSDGDPLRFVVQQNLPRRGLNEGQRGILAAKLATLTAGTPIPGVPALTQEEAAALLGISRGTLQAARTIMELGSREQVDAVAAGRLGVGVVARELRKKNRGTLRKQMRERIDTNAAIWATMRDGIEAITALPLAADVVLIAKTHDRNKVVDRKLQRAIKWLEDFAHAWNARNGSQ